MMKEMYYIDLERREDARPEWASRDSDSVVPSPDKLISRFDPRRFPQRECQPVVRRRSLADVLKLIRRINELDGR